MHHRSTTAVRTLSSLLVAGLAVTGVVIHPSVAVADTTQIVSNASLGDWEMVTHPLSAPGSGGIGFEGSGPATPPEGTGSLSMATGAGDQAFTGRHSIETHAYDGTALNQLATLDYSTYIAARTAGAQVAPTLRISVDYVPAGSGILIFEPVYQSATGTIPEDTWDRWTAVDNTAIWWSSTPIPGLDCGTSTPNNCFRPWSAIKAAQGDATITKIAIEVGDLYGPDDPVGDTLPVGTPWDDFEGFVDGVEIDDGAGAGPITYDFEFADLGPLGHDVFALGDPADTGAQNRVWRFDLAAPGTASAATVVGGFDSAGETLGALAIHPDTGDLFGVTTDASHLGRVYRIYSAGSDAFVTTPVTRAPFSLPGANLGADFEPRSDATNGFVLHVTSDADVHVAVNADLGTVTSLAPLIYAPTDAGFSPDPAITAAAFGPGDPAPFYGIDTQAPAVVEVSPAGTLTTKGAIGGVHADERAGIDVTASGDTYATFSQPGRQRSRLFALDPETGDADIVATVGGFKAISGIALPDTGIVQFQSVASTPEEDDGTVVLTLERTGGAYGRLEVDVADLVSGGTATPGADYTFTDTTVVWADGDVTPQTVTLNLLDDGVVEGAETIVLDASDPRGVGNSLGATSQHTLTITDLEAGSLQFADASVSVAEGGGSVVLTVNRIGGDATAVSAELDITGGSATAGGDYQDVDGVVVRFPDGDATPNSVDVSVSITDDTAREGDETATIALTNPTGGAAIGTPGATTLGILDDPAGQLQFDPDIHSVDEGDTATVTVSRTGGNEGAVTATVASDTSGTATPGADFTAVSDTVSFAAANTSTSMTDTVQLVTLADDLFEGDETVGLDLSLVSGGATVADGDATVTIADRKVGLAVALTGDNRITSFDPADPASTSSLLPVTGLSAGDDLVGIDFRPLDGALYGVTVGNNATRVYEIDPATGAATQVTTGDLADLVPMSPPALPGNHFAADWEATYDRLRVVSDLGAHLVFDGDFNWGPGAPLTYAPTDLARIGDLPAVAAVAHDENVDPALVTNPDAATAYAIDHQNGTLVRIGSVAADPVPAQAGLVFTVGPLGIPAIGPEAGLDITTDGRAFASITDSGVTSLHSVDLTSGTATAVGAIGGGTAYTDVAFGPSGVLRFQAASPLTINGEGGTATVMVERAGGSFGEVTADFAARFGSATGADVALTPGTLTFPDGAAGTQSFNLAVADDSVFEGTEDLDLVLSNLTGGGVFAGLGAEETLDVDVEDDPLGILAFTGPFTADEDTGTVTVTVQRVGGGEGPLSFDYATEARTGSDAAAAGVDYTTTSGTITFAHGTSGSTADFSVALTADNDEELDERFDAVVTASSPATTLPGNALVTITNDDQAGSLSFSSATYDTTEDGSEVVARIVRTGGTDGALSVDLRTTDGVGGHAAAAGSDYVAVSDRVTLAHGAASLDVAIDVLDDTAAPELEGQEAFDVDLSNPTDIPGRSDELGTPSASTVTIRDTEPGTVYAVTADVSGDQKLVSFPTARPDDVTMIGTVSGLADDEDVAAVDVDPGSGDVLAVVMTAAPSTGRIALVDSANAALTPVGPIADGFGNPFPLGTGIGFDFDPVRGVARLVDDAGSNLRLDVDTGAPSVTLTEDAPLFYEGGGPVPEVAASAYTDDGGGASTLFGIDVANDHFVRQGVPGDPASADDGGLTDIGDLGVATASDVGLDVDPWDRALASIGTALYSIDTATGAARHVGEVGGASPLTLAAMTSAPNPLTGS